MNMDAPMFGKINRLNVFGAARGLCLNIRNRDIVVIHVIALTTGYLILMERKKRETNAFII